MDCVKNLLFSQNSRKVILRTPLIKLLSGETYYFRKNNRFWVEWHQRLSAIGLCNITMPPDWLRKSPFQLAKSESQSPGRATFGGVW
jgi:hypothetical protein